MIEAGVGSDIFNLDRGAVATLIRVGGKGVAIGWRFFSSPLFEPLEYDRRSTVYLGGCKVRPEYRGRGIYPYLLQHMFADCESSTCAIAETSQDNLSSQRGLQKAGFQRRGLVHRLIIGGCLVRSRLVDEQVREPQTPAR
jgi:ribosomal protein S18 acetylase RimI-like enzyme